MVHMERIENNHRGRKTLMIILREIFLVTNRLVLSPTNYKRWDMVQGYVLRKQIDFLESARHLEYYGNKPRNGNT